MSAAIFGNQARHLRETLVNAVWRQWAHLGGSVAVASNTQTRCVIDPEALILITLWLADDERRLIDVALSWTRVNSDFISVQRINNLKGTYPVTVSDRLPGFARVVAESGGDARWKPLSSGPTPAPPLAHRDNKRRAVRVDLHRPTVLWLRLRGIFGLGIRPDVIAFLMRRSDPREYIDAGRIADAIGYSRPAVKRVLDALVEAGGLTVAPERDPGYAIGWSPLFTILQADPDTLPPWRYCHQTFALVAEYLALMDERGNQAPSAFLQRVDARRMIQQHGGYLIENRLFLPHEFPQLDEVEPFVRQIERMLAEEF